MLQPCQMQYMLDFMKNMANNVFLQIYWIPMSNLVSYVIFYCYLKNHWCLMYFTKVILEPIYHSKSLVKTLNYVFENNMSILFTTL